MKLTRTRSLRLRLLVLSVVSTAAALAIGAAVLMIIFDRHINQRVLGELRQRSNELVGVLTLDATRNPVIEHPLADPRYTLPYGGAYWQVAGQGRPLLRSRSLWDATLKVVPPQNRQPDLEQDDGPDGDRLDVLTRSVTLHGESGDASFLVSIAFGRKDVQALQQSFALEVVSALVVIGAVLVGGAWLQVGLGLRPLRALRERLRAIHEGQAAAVDGPFPDEIAPLVTDLNRLFDQQRQSMLRARHQAGDLAHALKTPLTIIEGEALRLRQRGLTESADLFGAQGEAMRRQVDRVLARARVHGLFADERLTTDLSTTVDNLFAVMRRMPKGDVLAWVNAVPPGTTIPVELDDLGEILGNLLDNARKWARSTVTVSAKVSNNSIAIAIAITDDGPGLPSGFSFESLGRGARGSDEVEGTGLGLSIVQDLLAAYGTSLALSQKSGAGLCASLIV